MTVPLAPDGACTTLQLQVLPSLPLSLWWTFGSVKVLSLGTDIAVAVRLTVAFGRKACCVAPASTNTLVVSNANVGEGTDSVIADTNANAKVNWPKGMVKCTWIGLPNTGKDV